MQFARSSVLLMAIFIISAFSSKAQSPFIPYNADYYHLIDRMEIKYRGTGVQLFPGMKPYQRKDVANFLQFIKEEPKDFSVQDEFNLNYLADDNWEWMGDEYGNSERPLGSLIFKKKADAIQHRSEKFDFHFNPILYLGVGYESDQEYTPYINTRGFEVRGTIDQKISFYSYVGENQFVAPSHAKAFISKYNAIPGEGFYKGFKQYGNDFFAARGYITFNVSESINLQYGYDKNFIGSGFRSLILSDFSNAYHFLKLNTRVWKFNYMNLFTEMRADTRYLPGTRKYPKKFVNMHHLSINIGRKFNLGIFEAIAFGVEDSIGTAKYELSYLNPIIFYRAIEHQGGSTDNSLIGADFKYYAGKGLMFYGQVVLDEFHLANFTSGDGWWANKYSTQLGFKSIDLLGIPNLDLQAEYNNSRPFTYSHSTIYTNYAQYNQPLAHPQGANFKELVAVIRYQPVNRLSMVGKLIAVEYGDDPDANTNYGKDVLKNYNTRVSEFGNEIGQGVNTKDLRVDFTTTFQLKHNFFIDLNAIARKIDTDSGSRNVMLANLALRWNVGKRNWDF